jgi:hypothetical protein
MGQLAYHSTWSLEETCEIGQAHFDKTNSTRLHAPFCLHKHLLFNGAELGALNAVYLPDSNQILALDVEHFEVESFKHNFAFAPDIIVGSTPRTVVAFSPNLSLCWKRVPNSLSDQSTAVDDVENSCLHCFSQSPKVHHNNRN